LLVEALVVAHALDELRGAENGVAAVESNLAAVAFDDFAFTAEAGVGGLSILAAFDIDVGPEQLQDLAGGGVRINDDPVHELEHGQVLGPEVFTDVGAVGALGDGGIAGQRDDEHVPELPGELQVADVAGVYDVEAAVALHDGAAGAAQLLPYGGQLGGRHNLAVHWLRHDLIPRGRRAATIGAVFLSATGVRRRQGRFKRAGRQPDKVGVPDVSLIIPSSRPEAVLAGCLESVAAQHFDPRRIELVVVFNGLREAPKLDPGRWPFQLRTGFVAEASICAAKNRALDLARGQFVILLNDDVRLSPGFVAAHVKAHEELGQAALVLGASPFAVYADETLFDRLIAETSMIFFYDRMQPHRWYNFRHAWNLNLSFRRQDAAGVEFDERLVPVNFDDVEWAFRLERERGLQVWYEPAASLLHEHRYTLDSYLAREGHLGRMAAQLWDCNPACFEAIYGRDLSGMVETARKFVAERAGEAQELREALVALLARAATAIQVSDAALRELIRVLYIAHRPLKRFCFYRGLLEACGGSSDEVALCGHARA
jgi:glycosyltransferase involved in cell wall biosynthesis